MALPSQAGSGSGSSGYDYDASLDDFSYSLVSQLKYVPCLDIHSLNKLSIHSLFYAKFAAPKGLFLLFTFHLHFAGLGIFTNDASHRHYFSR